MILNTAKAQSSQSLVLVSATGVASMPATFTATATVNPGPPPEGDLFLPIILKNSN
ncbi:MAG: hypothetical protein JW953_20350 [Anaerolineae bacterium]|nr:hypothetical protein [Anaerolineae bacterium]